MFVPFAAAQDTGPSLPAGRNENRARSEGSARIADIAFWITPQAMLAAALKSQEPTDIFQAISAVIFSGPWSRDQRLSALQALLVEGDREVRLAAAHGLYVMGVDSGRDALVGIVRSPRSIPVQSPAFATGEGDLRVAAAEVLGTFRETAARSAVVELYTNTKAAALIRPMINLGVEEAAGWLLAASRNEISSELLEAYGLLNRRAELGRITALRDDAAAAPAIRLAAAWALARMGGDDTSAALIRRYVADQMEGATADLAELKRAVKYLGSLGDEASGQLLAQVARQAKSPDLVRIAVVNLILNQPGGSVAARELILAELRGPPTKLGRELAFMLAAAAGDESLRRAGEDYDRKHPEERLWQRIGEDRSRWSAWGWASGFVLTLAHPAAGSP